MASWSGFSSLLGFTPKGGASNEETAGFGADAAGEDPSKLPVRIDLPGDPGKRPGLSRARTDEQPKFGPSGGKPETPSSRPPRNASSSHGFDGRTSRSAPAAHHQGSFGSVGYNSAAVNSFGSTMTDYDNLISPGAQAENDPEYREAVYGPYSGMQGMPPPWAMPGFMPPGYPGGMPFPPFNPALAAAAAAGGLAPWGGFPAQFPPTQMANAPDMQAAHCEAMAEQYLAAARQLQAVARSARNDEGKGGGSQSSRRKKTGSTPVASQQAPATLPRVIDEGSPSNADRPDQECTVPEEERTTVMLRNLPNDYTREMLLELLDGEGFKGAYDFVYLPQDFKRKAGLGYAFVNLVTHDVAEEARAHFQGFSTWKFSSQKVCEAAWGTPLQGLEQHVERYKNSPLMHGDVPDAFKPVLFNDGLRIPFPPATKRLRPPRVKLHQGGDAASSNPT